MTPTASNTLEQTTTLEVTATYTPIWVASNTPIPTVANCSPSYNSSFEDRVVFLINEQRALNGLPALIVRPQLTAAARGHSLDMACNNYFSHTGSDGSTSRDRVLREGYYATWVGENIYGGQLSTADSVVTWWMNSTPHRANILNVNYYSIGIGYVNVSNSMYQKYWTANFAQP